MTTSLVGTRIKDNVKLLTEDPIVRELSRELARVGVDPQEVSFSACNKEYEKRGGNNALTLGAVKDALIKLSEEAENGRVF